MLTENAGRQTGEQAMSKYISVFDINMICLLCQIATDRSVMSDKVRGDR